MHDPMTQDQIDAILAPIIAKRNEWDRAREYAGPNIMAHHDAPIKHGGMAGGYEAMAAIWSPERAKFRAGLWLREARLYRRMGRTKTAAHCLEQAARARRFAAKATTAPRSSL